MVTAKPSVRLRIVLFGMLGLLVVLQARLWLSDEGWSEVLRLRQSVATQAAENGALRDRNERLEAEVADLKGGFAALEERARADLGMIARDESFYLIVPAPATANEEP